MTGPPVQARLRFALDEHLTVLSASAGVNSLLGHSAEDFLSSRVVFRDLIHLGDCDIAKMLFSPELPTQSGAFNLRLRHADGRIRCVSGQITHRSAEGKETKILDLWLQDAKSQFESQGAPESLTTIRPMMDIVEDALYFKNCNHVYTAANRKTRQMVSRACRQAMSPVGQTDYDLFPEEYADVCYRQEREALAGRKVADEAEAPLEDDGSKLWVSNRRYPVKDPNGEVIGLFGTTHDETRTRETLERLRESDESLKESQRIAGVGSYITDLRRGEWTSSDVLDELFGIGKDYVRSLEGWVALVHPDEQEGMVAYFTNEVIGERRPFDREFRIIRQTDGAVRWVHGRGRLEFDAQGEPHKIYGTIQDITERKLADAALRESEESLKESERIAGLGSYTLDIGTGMWTSSAVLDGLFGIGGDYVRSVDGWAGLVHLDDRGKMAAYFASEVLGQSKAFDQEYRIVRCSDGAPRWVHGMGRLEFDTQGRPVKMHGTIQDITERKLADAALRESEELLKESQRIAGLGSYIGELASGDWTSSDMLDQMFGIDKNYVRTIEGWAALVHPDDRAMMMSYFGDEVLGKDKAFDKEYRIVRHADGAVRWVHDLGRLEFDAEGRPVKMHGTIKDITERKQNEIDLRESKELLQLFIEHAPAALAMLDREMHYLAVSHRWLEIHSLVGRDVIGHSHYETFPKVDESWKEEHRRALAGEVVPADEGLLEHADGSKQWIKRRIQPWKTGTGEVGDVLDIEDVMGKRLVDTRLQPRITIGAENAIAALEVMSRYAVDPKWLIYLPPTMSPSETTKLPGLLEHPNEAFAYYRHEGIPRVVCEQKHMGSRAVVVVCRDENVSIQRFGVVEPSLGVAYSRTGRRFFADHALEREFLIRLQQAASASGLWEELGTDWLCLDCELMPWSAKAQELLTSQYAPVGTAGTYALIAARQALADAQSRTEGLHDLAVRTNDRLESILRYREAYRHYCWPVASIQDLKLAPFHFLASEGAVHTDKQHTWHMELLGRLCAADSALLLATPFRVVDLNDTEGCEDATTWWAEMTAAGNEGMVVKPLDFISKGRRGFAQPAIKCRGPEYLRIIYGPEYLLPENLERLRSRGVGAKRLLASREFALGIEALERFVRKEPLRRTHECVFGVLALESEPVDPRL